jgi:WD40 repeat protein
MWEVESTSGDDNAIEMSASPATNQFFLSPDGSRLASLYEESVISVLEIASGESFTLTVPQVTVNLINTAGDSTVSEESGKPDSVGFNPDGTILAAGLCSERQVSDTPDGEEIDACVQNEILLWDISAGELLKRIPTDQPGAILSLAFNPMDENLIASGFEDGSIRLWEIEQGHMTGLPMIGLGGPVTSLAFHQDGDILASGGANKLIALWNLNPPQLLGDPISGADGAITGLSFSPNTGVLYSATDKGTVTRLDIESWKLLACELAGRNLTRAEWEQFFPTLEYRATCDQLPLDEPTPTPSAAPGGSATPGPVTPTPTP